MTVAKYFGRMLVVALVCAGISACQTGPAGSGNRTRYTQGEAQTFNGVLTSRATRIRNLLDNCSSPAVSDASGQIANAATSLVNEGGPDSGYLDADIADAQWRAFFIAQDAAYDAAKACGLIDPSYQGAPSGWNATWDDISS